ncbi:hypothetical protein [Aquimarina mytili]|uniref:Uncharacterized protein n=1 Tax=Aquimarina mytili TaxID=874423 RepID=A0A936ZP13_9FLAO|nr:hypothetical protein [Aquimarina mytili]MBL0682098.1 hypothetical protein [Aquimarina mytili]
MLKKVLELKNVTVLEKAAQQSINGGGIQSCVRRHQRLIIRTQETEPFDKEQRSIVINGIIEDAKKCYTKTNVF